MNYKIDKHFYFILTLLTLLTAASISFLLIFKEYTDLAVKISFIAILIGLLVWFLLAYIFKKEKTHKTLFLLIFIANALSWAYLFLSSLNLLSFLTSLEEIKALILDTGIYGILVFGLLQFAQVCLLPIPAGVSTIAGVIVFGPLTASIVGSIAVILGSLFSFFVWGRLVGIKAVKFIAGEERTERYREILNKRGKLLLPLMFLFPMFPDDILCAVAGVSKMSSKYFIITSLITRPISMTMFCFVTSGSIIPFSGWGLAVWPLIILAIAFVFIYVFRHGEELEQKIINKFPKLNKKD